VNYLLVKKSLSESSKILMTLDDFCFTVGNPEIMWTYDFTRNVQHCVMCVLISKKTGVANENTNQCF